MRRERGLKACKYYCSRGHMFSFTVYTVSADRYRTLQTARAFSFFELKEYLDKTAAQVYCEGLSHSCGKYYYVHVRGGTRPLVYYAAPRRFARFARLAASASTLTCCSAAAWAAAMGAGFLLPAVEMPLSCSRGT